VSVVGADEVDDASSSGGGVKGDDGSYDDPSDDVLDDDGPPELFVNFTKAITSETMASKTATTVASTISKSASLCPTLGPHVISVST
jgi:hypothetical protein